MESVGIRFSVCIMRGDDFDDMLKNRKKRTMRIKLVFATLLIVGCNQLSGASDLTFVEDTDSRAKNDSSSSETDSAPDAGLDTES